MNCPIFHPQSLPTEANRTVRPHHSLLRSRHHKHVRRSGKMAFNIATVQAQFHAHPQPIKTCVWIFLFFSGVPSCLSGCGGVLTDSEGSFSSPNHPGSYPPNRLCVWVIRVPPPSLVQIHVSSLAVEGPSPCLFDWLEVQEQIEQSSVVTRLVLSPMLSEHCSVLQSLILFS